jgi:putative pyruvate formate lyase activating enzyme
MSSGYPSYLGLYESGELACRARQAVDCLADCALCGRECHADRSQRADPRSYCRVGRQAYVSSVFPHPGEEVCLSGSGCSGTIFFSRCNLRCVFCQNFDISWQGRGRPVQPQQLAEMMLDLQADGCHNINLVTPSHVVPQILEALLPAVEQGLRLPLVYNTGGYDRVETLRLLEGVVDIYMPDLKFWQPEVSKELADAEDYAQVACRAVKEMHRQVGDLVLDERGLARRGLLVRHLVMPGGLDDTRQIMRFLATEISPDTFVNIMPQYRPEGLAAEHQSINRPLTMTEYNQALAIAEEEGLRRFDQG